MRRTAAEIGAAAIYELFPGVQLWGGGESRVGFFYDLYFPHPIHPELHFQIEERMRQIVREKREIRDLDMVPFSARELLKSRGHLARAEELAEKRAEKREREGLVRIVQIGPFVDLALGDHLKNSSELAAFKLFPPILLERGGMRIQGAASSSKEELKEFLKKWAAYPKKRHEASGEKMGFWRISENGVVWLPEGLRFFEKTLSIFKENLFQNALEIRAPNGVNRLDLARELEVDSIGEVVGVEGEAEEDSGLFEPGERTEVRLTTTFENAISSLQSIGKTLTILGFNYCLQFTGSKRKEMKVLGSALEALKWECEAILEEGTPAQINFLVEDGLGGRWSAATVVAKGFISASAIIERNIALMMEQKETMIKTKTRIEAT